MFLKLHEGPWHANLGRFGFVEGTFYDTDISFD